MILGFASGVSQFGNRGDSDLHQRFEGVIGGVTEPAELRILLLEARNPFAVALLQRRQAPAPFDRCCTHRFCVHDVFAACVGICGNERSECSIDAA